MAEVLCFSEVDRFVPVNDPECPHFNQWYRSCEFCGESVIADICDNKTWRQFYWLDPDGFSVCEHCIAGIEPM